MKRRKKKINYKSKINKLKNEHPDIMKALSLKTLELPPDVLCNIIETAVDIGKAFNDISRFSEAGPKGAEAGEGLRRAMLNLKIKDGKL